MYCWNCGKKLPQDARFCIDCGSPVADVTKLLAVVPKQPDIIDIPATELADTAQPPESGQTKTVDISVANQDPNSISTVTETSDIEISAPPTSTDTPENTASNSQPAAIPSAGEQTEDSLPTAEKVSPGIPGEPLEEDLVIRRNHIVLSGAKLTINGRYYQKNKRRFKKQKGTRAIPLSFVTASTMLHSRCTVKTIAAFLLFLIFTTGTLASGYFDARSWDELNTPYLQGQTEELEAALERLESITDADLRELEDQLTEIRAEQSLAETQLADYQSKRWQERLRLAASDLDYGTVMTDDFFAEAFAQYITDLLDAFKNDRLLDSWLYPYYTYTLEQGTNHYIAEDNNLDMWFYALPGGEEKFSEGVEDLEALEWSVQEFTLYDRLFSHGRIYITASDFMNTVLYMPHYVADSALFVKIYGGNPDPAEMSVPGWRSRDYRTFWEDAESQYARRDPIWMYYDLSAEDFDVDWNQLVEEQAYYDAYLKFMDTVAPDLAVYDMVSYYGSDDAYGGMGFDITGREASPTEIIALYLENHPEALEALDIDLESVDTVYDKQIAETQTHLESLALQTETLESEQKELADFLNSGDALRAEYDSLSQETQAYNRELTGAVWIFSFMAVLLCLMTLICLFTFIHYAKKPRHLLVLELSDGETVAFSTFRCSKKKLARLQEQLP